MDRTRTSEQLVEGFGNENDAPLSVSRLRVVHQGSSVRVLDNDYDSAAGRNAISNEGDQRQGQHVTVGGSTAFIPAIPSPLVASGLSSPQSSRLASIVSSDDRRGRSAGKEQKQMSSESTNLRITALPPTKKQRCTGLDEERPALSGNKNDLVDLAENEQQRVRSTTGSKTSNQFTVDPRLLASPQGSPSGFHGKAKGRGGPSDAAPPGATKIEDQAFSERLQAQAESKKRKAALAGSTVNSAGSIKLKVGASPSTSSSSSGRSLQSSPSGNPFLNPALPSERSPDEIYHADPDPFPLQKIYHAEIFHRPAEPYRQEAGGTAGGMTAHSLQRDPFLVSGRISHAASSAGGLPNFDSVVFHSQHQNSATSADLDRTIPNWVEGNQTQMLEKTGPRPEVVKEESSSLVYNMDSPPHPGEDQENADETSGFVSIAHFPCFDGTYAQEHGEMWSEKPVWRSGCNLIYWNEDYQMWWLGRDPETTDELAFVQEMLSHFEPDKVHGKFAQMLVSEMRKHSPPPAYASGNDLAAIKDQQQLWLLQCEEQQVFTSRFVQNLRQIFRAGLLVDPAAIDTGMLREPARQLFSVPGVEAGSQLDLDFGDDPRPIGTVLPTFALAALRNCSLRLSIRI
ncbi:unnamed protein product [Amoebophrya sp. A25]|nr:unnamed protein product [Amoebophrya sp. A25]|eukprot:GSA25T00016154001.1